MMLQPVSMNMLCHAWLLCNMLVHSIKTFYNMIYYKHVTLNKVFVLEYHHVAHMSLAKMALALLTHDTIDISNIGFSFRKLTMYYY